MRTQSIVTVMFPLVVAAVLAGCGGSSPSGPSTPSVTPQSINVGSSSDRIFIGASETFTATATMSDGSTRSITGVWGTDAPGVATAEGATGRVTGVGSGMVTVFVDSQGRRGTKLIRGLPNYQGTWSGSYAVRSCTQSGQVAQANLCGGTFSTNRVLPTNLNVTQDADRVQGRFFLGTLGGDASGPVQGDGRLLLTGVIQDSGATVDVSWNLESQAAGRITGGFSMLWRLSGASGDVRVIADIRDLNRTSNIAAPALLTAPGAPRTVREMLRAVAGGV